MKNKSVVVVVVVVFVVVVVIVAVLAVVGVVAHDLLTNTKGSLPANAFAYDASEYAKVDSGMISYVESRQIGIRTGQPLAMTYANGLIYLLIDSTLQVITPQGVEKLRVRLDARPSCLAVDGTDILVGFPRSLMRFDASGSLLKRSTVFSSVSAFSDLAVSGDRIFVADAGAKRVRILNATLSELRAFGGESGVSKDHGFIIPSLHFDLAVNADGELWVVNPGVHQLQNYSNAGVFRGGWGKASAAIDGFSGCCNPYHIAFLSDGSMEKGVVRVKIHKPSGELASVVVDPSAFANEYKAPDVAVDERDNILVLDVERRMIRFFVPKK